MVNAPRGYKAYGEVADVAVADINKALKELTDFEPTQREIIYEKEKGKQLVIILKITDFDKTQSRKGNIYFDCAIPFTQGDTPREIVGIKYITDSQDESYYLFEFTK